jgi:hypothetical protein
MFIGAVQANFTRLSVETSDAFQQLKREATEAKLYYLRTVHSPEEFEALVEEELHRVPTIAIEREISMKKVARSVKKKISIFLNRRTI